MRLLHVAKMKWHRTDLIQTVQKELRQYAASFHRRSETACQSNGLLKGIGTRSTDPYGFAVDGSEYSETETGKSPKSH